jgi:hypothetical protein
MAMRQRRQPDESFERLRFAFCVMPMAMARARARVMAGRL